MSVIILRADALALPLADESVDLICTSPPYFGLRSYQDGGTHYPGQLGSEATPAKFVDALLAATREMVRVLKPSGSIWVNLGDKYAGAQNQRSRQGTRPLEGGRGHLPEWDASTPQTINADVRDKSLMGIPWRYALACIDRLGLILRAEVIWSKPNGLPESVTDRVRRSHETWFHLVRQPRYYSAVDEVREPQTGGAHRGRRDGLPPPGGKVDRMIANGDHGSNYGGTNPDMFDARGKLPGSVWTIPTEPLTVPPELGVDHFAAFPTEWPRRIITGWSPPGICVACGEGRRPVAERKPMQIRHSPRAGGYGSRITDGITGTMLAPAETTITGYACACPTPNAPTRPAVVLDPFGGTGTVALVADVLGRHGIHVDLSSDYNRLARWRCTDPAQRARAAQVPKPPPVIDGQLDLLGGLL